MRIHGLGAPVVQGTSNFKLFSLKEHENLGSHNVSVALWQSGGHVTSVICTLPVNVQEGIVALFLLCTESCSAMLPYRSGSCKKINSDGQVTIRNKQHTSRVVKK